MLATGVADVILEERPKLALNRHAAAVVSCLLLGAERTTSARREYFAF